jgi:IPT/TIG domain
LFGASLVSFGGTDTKDFHVDDDTQITVRLPENVGDGTVTVTVTTASGTDSSGPNSDFSYVFPIPVIQSINPTSGNVAGVDPVNINGLGFTGTNSVSFNNAGVVPTSVTDNQITVTPPPSSSSGPIDVTVTTPGGQSAPSQFTYVIPGPVVANVNPSSGSVGGGDPVTITGTGFTNVFSVDFGDALQPLAFTLVDDAHITMFSPPGSGIGPVSVSVTSPGGTSQIDSRAQFTYF